MVKRIIDKIGVIAIIIILCFAGLLLLYHPHYGVTVKTNDNNLSEPITYMDGDDEVVFLSYAYDVLDDYFDSKDASGVIDQDLEGFDFVYDKLFVTLICEGKIKGCMSGSAETGDENRLFVDIEQAVVRSIKDERYGGVLTKKESYNAEIVFTFLYNKILLESNKIDYLEDNLELGIHAIEVDNNGDNAFFKESVPISSNYDLETTLERLCIKAGLDDDAWKDSETKIYKYDTLTFVGDRDGKIIDLFRYNILVDVDDISNNDIYYSISSGRDWFLNNVDAETNLLEYLYYPSKDTYSSSNNHVRQLACIWAMSELDLFLGNNLSSDLIFKTLDYYLTFKNNSENYSFLIVDNDNKIAYNAFIILTLVNTPTYPDRDLLLKEFADGLLAMQKDDGSYKTYFNSDKNTGVDYYPGESMLALMKLYQSTRDERYISSVEKAFSYYRSYWRSNKNTAFIPWHSQVYCLLYQQTEDSELADFVFEINDWLIDNHQIQDDMYPDKIGGFPKQNPRNSASSYMEGVNAAYSLAVSVNDQAHIDKYYKSIRIGARFILQTQYTENNTFYLENPVRAVGGFKASLTSNDQRNDYTQHSVMALMRIYKNNIFE